MARRRYQCPTPKVENGWWYIRYRIDDLGEDGKLYRPQRYKQLATAETPLREVLKLRDEFLAPFNSGNINAGAAVRFCDYVTQVYETTNLPLLEPSSRDCYGCMIKTHLLPAFGKMKLRDLTRQNVQMFFTRLASTPKKIRCGKEYRTAILSLETRKKIWTALSAILSSAIGYKHITENPAKSIELGSDPIGKRIRHHVTREQFFALLKLIIEPYATAVFADALTGFRPSELFGLEWKNVHEHAITIEKKYARGHWGRPKTEASNVTVSVAPSVIERIHALKNMQVSVRAGTGTRVVSVVKSCGPDDLVFQSVYNGGPMSADNILKRHIKPAARILGIPWVNWQCLRRSTATWHKKAGNHVKDAQAFLRHSRSKTTIDIYTQTEDEAQREAIGRLELYAGVARKSNSSPDQRSFWDDVNLPQHSLHIH